MPRKLFVQLFVLLEAMATARCDVSIIAMETLFHVVTAE